MAEQEISEAHKATFMELQKRLDVYHEQIRKLRDEQEKIAQHLALIKATAHDELSHLSSKTAVSAEAMAVLRAACW